MEVLMLIVAIALVAYLGFLKPLKQVSGIAVTAIDTANNMANRELEMIDLDHEVSSAKRAAKLANKVNELDSIVQVKDIRAALRNKKASA